LKFCKILQILRHLQNFAENFTKIADFSNRFLCENFEIAAVQKDANLVELEKCCQTDIFLQNFVLIQPRTSPLKICKILQNLPILLTPNPLTASIGSRRRGSCEGPRARALCSAMPPPGGDTALALLKAPQRRVSRDFGSQRERSVKIKLKIKKNLF
jgi:hypothetical protein